MAAQGDHRRGASCRYSSAIDADGRHIGDLIARARIAKNAKDLSAAFVLGFTFGFPKDMTPTLTALLEEDAAWLLQQLADPRGTEALARTLDRRFPYLDYDDSIALANKCVWALWAIKTSDARKAVERAAASDPRERVRETAAERLAEWDEKWPP